MMKVRWRMGWRSWHMLIAKQQLILIYPGQGCGKLCSSPVREEESESESMTGLEVKRKVEAGG